MAAPTRIVSLNLGMQTVTLAEFHATPDGAITLNACKQEELIVDPAADVTRPAQIESAIDNLRKALKLPAKFPVNYCLPSQSVFARFVKLPGATPEDVTEIIAFEAQQNVPFPIDEVVWDYQIMGESKENNWDVALVAIKADQLGETNDAVNRGGFRSGVIDVAPMALYNAFRYNYSELTGSSLLIDIGARTTNLVFVEGKRVFSRSIPVGGATISAAIGKEFKQDITVGEKLKLEKGFVGLGGAYAEPDDPTETRISKLVRNTMTRLHAEIARSISFYRQNQGGSAPVRAFLCGGTSGLPYMLEFFSEKLQIPIEHFNPLRNVTVANEETAAFVSTRAHALGEVVGTALRGLKNCPMEINLRPASVVREQDLARRKPFLVLAGICLVLAPATWWFYFHQAKTLTEQNLDSVNQDVAKLEAVAKQFDALNAEAKKLVESAAPLLLASAERGVWAQIIDDLGQRLPSRYIWVTEVVPLVDGKTPYQVGESSTTSPVSATPSGGAARPGATPPPAPKIDALRISGLYLERLPNDTRSQPQLVVDDFVNNLQKSSVFKIEEKDKSRIIIERQTPDGQKWAYNYTLVLPLRNPIALP
jgi:Tfp pilus assembly protein, ATPase PilM